MTSPANMIRAAGTPANDAEEPEAPWATRVVNCSVDWFTKAPKPRDWLLRDPRRDDAGVLVRGKVGIFLAGGGIGKTMALVQLALSVASQDAVPWLGCYAVTRPGRVLLILGEEDSEEVPRRLYYARRAVNSSVPEPGSIVAIPLAGMPVPMIERTPQGEFIDAPFVDWIRGFVRDRGPFDLVAIDPLSRFAGADAETDAAAATRFVQACESVALSCGATVVVAHHTNKLSRAKGTVPTDASSRGSSALTDGSRWTCAMTSDRVPLPTGETSDLVTFEVVKSNYSAKGDPLTLVRDERNGGALVRLSQSDRERLDVAIAAADPSERKRARRDERGRERVALVADSIRAALRMTPGMTYRRLLGAVRSELGTCGQADLDAGIASLGDALRIERGAKGANWHFLSVSEES